MANFPVSTIHVLNRRYFEEWQRAEKLQAELDNLKNSRFYRWLMRFRAIKKLFLPEQPPRNCPPVFSSEDLSSFRVPPQGSVTLIIPLKDQADLLINLVASFRRSTYRRFEVLLVDNGSTCPRTLQFLKRLSKRKLYEVLTLPGQFNFSRLCNQAARQARGRFLLFLNNDMEVLSPDWLDHLLSLAGNSAVGPVGGHLLYPDGTLQHAGIFEESPGVWSHRHRGGRPQDCPAHPISVPAVTGACLMIRRKLFQALGGFDENLPVVFNDVDLCCRARDQGYLVALAPEAQLVHFESLSRGYSKLPG